MEKAISLSNINLCKNFSSNYKLSDVPVGKSCKVKTLNATGLLRNRMLDIGIIPGTQIEVIRHNYTGDAAAFNIKGAVIALRKEESSLIDVVSIE